MAKKEAWAGNILNANPKSALAPKRALASIDQDLKEANKAMFEKIIVGENFIIQNSIEGWQDEVVSVVDKFEDKSIRVKFQNGKTAFIKGYNLARTLSPEVSCGQSHGVEICKDDEVFHPIRSTSLQLPEGKVMKIFQNGTVVVRDGADFYLTLDQVGKPVTCSPQKESICEGDYVIADAYKDVEKFTLEGPVERIYTNGVAVVKMDNYWRFPIQSTALMKRISSLKGEESPGVISSREFTIKKDQRDPFGAVTPEILPVEEVPVSRDAQ